MEIRAYKSHDEDAVVGLWKQCDLVRPWNDPHLDIRRKLADSPEMFLVGVVDQRVVASVMAGYDGHRGWINYFAVAPDLQRQGLARALLAEAERLLRKVGCPKINLQVRGSNKSAVTFYERVGYSRDEVISLGKRLENDERTGPLGEPRT